jgi:hypothetical protein
MQERGVPDLNLLDFIIFFDLDPLLAKQLAFLSILTKKMPDFDWDGSV